MLTWVGVAALVGIALAEAYAAIRNTRWQRRQDELTAQAVARREREVAAEAALRDQELKQREIEHTELCETNATLIGQMKAMYDLNQAQYELLERQVQTNQKTLELNQGTALKWAEWFEYVLERDRGWAIANSSGFTMLADRGQVLE